MRVQNRKWYCMYVMPTLLQFLEKNADQVLTFEFGEWAMTCEEYKIHCLTSDDEQDRTRLSRQVYTMEGSNGEQVYIKMPDATTDSFLATIDAPTDVIFRKFSKNVGDEIIAIMPGIADACGTVRCYQHVGQHGNCNRLMLWNTKPAKPEEYADLKKELEDAPHHYRFRVLKRWPAR